LARRNDGHDRNPPVRRSQLPHRTRNLTKLAKATGTIRQALYTALSENGNPTLETLLKVLAAVGIRLKCEVGAARAAWQRSSKQRIASAEWQLVGGMTSGGAM
jgi:hypothetical protein